MKLLIKLLISVAIAQVTLALSKKNVKNTNSYPISIKNITLGSQLPNKPVLLLSPANSVEFYINEKRILVIGILVRNLDITGYLGRFCEVYTFKQCLPNILQVTN